MLEGRGWLLAVAVTALGFALRAAGIAEFWVNGDEGIYDFIAHAPAWHADAVVSRNAHPFLYFELLRWIAAVGDDYLWLRLPALVFGSLTIFVLYQLGREAGGEACGLAAAGALALAPGAVALSQVIRPYALVAFLGVAALLFLGRFLRRGGARDLTLYVVCMGLALLTQYGSFLLLGGIVAALAAGALAGRLERAALRGLAVAHLPLMAVIAGLYAVHIRGLVGSGIQSDAVENWLATQFVAGPGDAWRSFVGLLDYLLGARFVGLGLVAFAGGAVMALRDRRFALVGLVAAVLAAAVVLSAAALYPFGGTRHSFYLAPVVLLPMAYGVARALGGGGRTVVMAALLALALVGLGGPIGAQLGAAGAGKVLPSEFEIPRHEMESLRPALEALAATPGLAVTDVETVHVLSPILREARSQGRLVLEPPSEVFKWGERIVLIDLLWSLDAGPARFGTEKHLGPLLERIGTQEPKLAELLARDLLVVSADGMRIPRSIRRLRGGNDSPDPILEELVRSPHFVVLRLDPDRYRALLSAHGAGRRPGPRAR